MSISNPDIYKVAVPEGLRGDLEEAIREAAAESNLTDEFSISTVDPQEAASELQFDPLTALVVLKFVLESAAAFLVGMAVERMIKKISVRQPGGARIIVMFPDGEIETIDTSDAAATKAALKRLKDGVA
jgi:hypothetical protein